MVKRDLAIAYEARHKLAQSELVFTHATHTKKREFVNRAAKNIQRTKNTANKIETNERME